MTAIYNMCCLLIGYSRQRDALVWGVRYRVAAH